jgi:hypothetical protein
VGGKLSVPSSPAATHEILVVFLPVLLAAGGRKVGLPSRTGYGQTLSGLFCLFYNSNGQGLINAVLLLSAFNSPEV